MPTLTFSYTGSVSLKKTSFLEPQTFDMSYDATYDLEASDVANQKTIQKEFQATMDKAVKAQTAHLTKWLSEKDALIATMVKRHDELKASFPLTQQAAADYAKQIQEITTTAKQLDEFPKDYNTIVNDWAANCREQQGLIAMQTAVKKARVTVFDAKGFRVKAGIAIKATLVVAAIAMSIAAIVLTAGATAPIFVALAAAGIALSGIGGLGGIAKTLVENGNTEKKILASVTKDVEAITSAFNGVKDKSTSLKKHVTELVNLTKIRVDKVREIENDCKKYKAEASGYAKSIAELNSSKMVDTRKVQAKQKACGEVNAKLDGALKKIAELKGDNQKAGELLKGLSDLGVEIEKVSGQSSNSVIGNLKSRFTSIDGWLDLSSQLGSISSGASSLHS